VDLNNDKQIDIISGSYRSGTYGNPTGASGPFYVLHGDEGGEFKKPVQINDAKGDMLVMKSKKRPREGETLKSCPFPVDLNGDGITDLVSGNAAGTFAVYIADKDGKFPTQPQWLEGPDGKLLSMYSDSGPVFYDWDSDGDMDLISGSGYGDSIKMFVNTGSKTEPKFAEPVVLIETPGLFDDGSFGVATRRLGTAHIKMPNQNVRIAIGDVNRDGKPDLIMGDRQFLHLANKGVSEETANAKLKAWQKKYDAVEQAAMDMEDRLDFDNEDNWDEADKKLWNDYMEGADKLEDEFDEFASEEFRGFIWVCYQK